MNKYTEKEKDTYIYIYMYKNIKVLELKSFENGILPVLIPKIIGFGPALVLLKYLCPLGMAEPGLTVQKFGAVLYTDL